MIGQCDFDLSKYCRMSVINERLILKCEDPDAYIEVQVKTKSLEPAPYTPGPG